MRAAGKAADAAQAVADVAAIPDAVEDLVELVETGGLADVAAQMAEDAAVMAASKLLGKDPVVPGTGTPGMIMEGSPNVLIGGVPLPASMAIAKGLLKRVKPRKFSGRGAGGGAGVGAPT